MNAEELLTKLEQLEGMYWTDNPGITPKFRSVLNDIKIGKPIIIVDDYDRENEGDLMIGGQMATVENIAFMARWGRGIMCLPAEGWLLDWLGIPMMVPPEKATDPFNTPFTVSVDAKEGISTGVSASDRVATIQVMLSPIAEPTDLVRPGHLFPLRARPDLLLERKGHTEASVTLMKLMGYTPLAVIVEVMNDNGSMARLPELEALANQHGLQIISIPEIVAELGL